MGLIDKIKKIFSRKKVEMLPERTSKWHSYRIPETEEDISIFDIQMNQQYMDNQGNMENVYIARAMRYNPENAISIDLADYICFELTPELSEKIFGNEQTKKYFLDNLAVSYNLNHEKNPEENRFYFGNINQVKITVNNRGKIGYKIVNNNENINREFNNYVDIENAKQNKVTEKYNTRQEFLREMDARESVRKEQERLKEEERKYNIIRNNRINNPFLLPQKNKDGKNDYQNLDGIDLASENKGDILRIRNLKKIGKDANGTYLYSAYLSRAREMDDHEDFSNKDSLPVCFELYTKIENILEGGNQAEIDGILKFLSKTEEYKDKEKMNFIGQLKKKTQREANGQITTEIVERRSKIASSSAIHNAVEKIQNEFKNQQQR